MDMKPRLRRFFDKHTDLREAVRYLLTRLGIHRGSTTNDILLLSSRRAGSTWLMEVIASEPGIRFVNEPLRPEYVAKLKLPTELDSLPADERKILGVPSPAEDRFRALFADYRMTRTFGPYDFFSPQFHWLTTRRIIKDVYAASIADWIQEQSFGFKTIYLIRHPIPTALSMSRGCTLRIAANLKHPTFAQKFLNQHLVEFSWWMLDHGSELEMRVLEWCLDNIVPWTIVNTRQHDWLVITYEELMLSPDRSLQLIADHLGLRHVERLRQAMIRPSASTHNSRVKLVRSSDPVSLVQAWRSSVSAEMEKQVYAIIQEFGISAYEYGAYVARDEFLHFLETPRLKNLHWEPVPEDRLATSSL